MNGIFLKLLLSLLVTECIFYGKYFVFGVWNQSCVSIRCSCCVDKKCDQGLYFENECLNGCIDGQRSARCYEMCPYNCKSCKDGINICDKCFDGFYLDKMDCKSCPSNCKTCFSSLHCDTCKEGFYDQEGSSTCDYYICPKKCECYDTNCVACKNGFYDNDNSCNKICPLNCLACSSFENCSKCKNGFYNGNGPNGNISPRLNDCTYKCRDACIICSSYDNCLKCASGKYGLQCQENCSVGCKNNICLAETGRCNCTSNFSGEKCSECVTGKYGDTCQHNCPANCENNRCQRLLGNCIKGCKTDNMFGATCDKCIHGRYGTVCEKSCSENCKNQKCDKDSGNCSDGWEDKSQSVSADNSTLVVIAVLATLLAVACAVIVFLMVKKILKKIRSADRQPTESFAQVHFENTLVEEQSTHSGCQTAVSDEESITYEVLDKTEAPEHAYDLTKPKALHSPDSAGHKVYENMKV